jgi:hypothetical protein
LSFPFCPTRCSIGQLQRGLRFLEAGLRLAHRRVVEALLDDEEEIAFLDVGAFGEQPLLQEAIDAGAQVDLVDRLDAAGESMLNADIFLERLGNRDCRWRRRRRRLVGLLAITAAGQRRADDEQRRQTAGR